MLLLYTTDPRIVFACGIALGYAVGFLLSEAFATRKPA